MRDEKLTLKREGGDSFEVPQSTLLVFLDETGEESLSDKNAPFFGLGGLIIVARNYFDNVEKPWHKLKDQHFDGYAESLHASELKNPYVEQIEGLNRFFHGNDFGRFAITCTDNTLFEINAPIEDVLMATLWDRIKEVGNNYRWHGILVIYEENDRLMPAFQREFMSKIPKNQNNETIGVDYFAIKKDPVFAGLEVADFIVHTAGRQARIMREMHFEKNLIKKQPDFSVIFSDGKPTSYLSVSRVSSNAK